MSSDYYFDIRCVAYKHCKPIPLMKTGFFSQRKPCFHYREPCSHCRDGFAVRLCKRLLNETGKRENKLKKAYTLKKTAPLVNFLKLEFDPIWSFLILFHPIWCFLIQCDLTWSHFFIKLFRFYSNLSIHF